MKIGTNPSTEPRACANKLPVHLCGAVYDDVSDLPELIDCAPEVLRDFLGMGVPMFELYGMTENCAVATANRPGRNKIGTVGEPYPDIGFRIERGSSR